MGHLSWEGRFGILQSTPLKGPDDLVGTPQPGLGSDTNRHIPTRGPPHLSPLHHHSTILCSLGPDYALTVLFLGTHTKTSQSVIHNGSALVRYLLNFRVPMNSEASELPKGLMLGRDGNIHIRITPLGDVGSYIY
ncbi:hypothetical protein DVH24_026167 [Malus domestica]|uniref:Uncharacterized protein n=1 Tax=Malus domestica TaxID=3750 RepID=A0A498KIN1_MALDO|nr:hypothetical protein DVH24_026167 [Malus domestica]